MNKQTRKNNKKKTPGFAAHLCPKVSLHWVLQFSMATVLLKQSRLRHATGIADDVGAVHGNSTTRCIV